MLEDKEKNTSAAEEKAPAVVGQLKVSNDLLDFSSLAKKSAKKKECPNDGTCTKDDENLTPRQRAILARKNK